MFVVVSFYKRISHIKKSAGITQIKRADLTEFRGFDQNITKEFANHGVAADRNHQAPLNHRSEIFDIKFAGDMIAARTDQNITSFTDAVRGQVIHNAAIYINFSINDDRTK